MLSIDLPFAHEGFHDLAIKLVTNAISTYAQAAGRGALFKAMMISTGPANDKIYARCLGLIARTVGISSGEAEVALLRRIYGIDDIAIIHNHYLPMPRIEHIRAGVLPPERRHEPQIVLPVAFLLAHHGPSFPAALARHQAQKEPRISILLQDILCPALMERAENETQSQTLPIASGLIKINPVIRKANEGDRSALYHACLKTGDAGQDAENLFVEKTLLGEIYVGPYLTYSPEFALCLSVSGYALGYCLAVLDTLEFHKRCEAEWWPSLRIKYRLNDSISYPLRECSLIANQIHCRTPLDVSLLASFPSHLHIDLVDQMQGQGYGMALMKRQLEALQLGGSKGVHLTMAASNHRANLFYQKLGFRLLLDLPNSNEQVLGLRFES